MSYICAPDLWAAIAPNRAREALLAYLQGARPWRAVSTHLPEPLQDVQVALVDHDGEPLVEIGFMRDDGTWWLTGHEGQIHPSDWAPLLTHPEDL